MEQSYTITLEHLGNLLLRPGPTKALETYNERHENSIIYLIILLYYYY
jgi:hypothetical protein